MYPDVRGKPADVCRTDCHAAASAASARYVVGMVGFNMVWFPSISRIEVRTSFCQGLECKELDAYRELDGERSKNLPAVITVTGVTRRWERARHEDVARMDMASCLARPPGARG